MKNEMMNHTQLKTDHSALMVSANGAFSEGFFFIQKECHSVRGVKNGGGGSLGEERRGGHPVRACSGVHVAKQPVTHF